MSKVIFFHFPMHGHMNPCFGLIKELVKSGEDVICYATDEFRESLISCGATFNSYGEQANKFFKEFSVDNETSETLKNNFFFINELLICTGLNEVNKNKPDYIIHDAACYWGKAIAEILGIPHVSSFTTFALNKKLSNQIVLNNANISPLKIPNLISNAMHFAKFKIKLNKKFGIQEFSPVNLISNTGDLNLVYTSKYFQPFSSELDDSFKFVGPSIRSIESVSNDIDFSTLKYRKTICISLGTLQSNSKSAIRFYNKFFKAFRNKPVNVIMVVGKKINISLLEDIPSNFIVRSFIPQLKVLQHSDLFITHGGMNSVNEGLFFKVPLIVIPLAHDQYTVAEQIEKLGAGIRLNKNQLTSSKIFETYLEILNDENFKINSEKISNSLHQAGGYSAAIKEILIFKKKVGIETSTNIKFNKFENTFFASKPLNLFKSNNILKKTGNFISGRFVGNFVNATQNLKCEHNYAKTPSSNITKIMDNYNKEIGAKENSVIYSEKNICTFDNCTLKTLEIFPVNIVSDKYIVYVSGRAASFEKNILLGKNLAHRNNCNVLMFNLRGINTSTGIATKKLDLVVDTLSVIEYLFYKGVKSKNIMLYGYSLGATIAPYVVNNLYKNNKPVYLYCDRGFSKISKFVSGLSISLLEPIGLNLLGTLLYSIIQPLFKTYMYFTGWEFNSTKQLMSIPKEYWNYSVIRSSAIYKNLWPRLDDGVVSYNASIHVGLKSMRKKRKKKLYTSIISTKNELKKYTRDSIEWKQLHKYIDNSIDMLLKYHQENIFHKFEGVPNLNKDNLITASAKQCTNDLLGHFRSSDDIVNNAIKETLSEHIDNFFKTIQ